MGNRIRSFYVYVGLGMLLLTSLNSFGQTLSKHNWYFGSTQNSIRFNRVTNVSSLLTNKANPFGTGGSAVATDPGNGNLLFYTDGNQVYDAQHLPMTNGDLNIITGPNTGNQPAAIAPVPKKPGKYFVFTNTAKFGAPGNIFVSVVDMGLFGTSTFPSPPFGAVESKGLAITTLTNQAEGMIILPHDNGEWYWLITQNANSTTFNATLIDDNSYTAIAPPTTSTSTVPTMTIAAFAYHEGLKKLAAAPSDANRNALIMDFNETNGALTFGPTSFIANSAVATTTEPAMYDIEWSATGQYIYLSRHGDTGAGITGDLLQYDVLNPGTTITTVIPVASTIYRSYGLQRGPDSLVYHLYQPTAGGKFQVGRVDEPENPAATAAYNAAPAGFAGIDFGGTQFSAYVPKDTVGLKVDFTFSGTCMKTPTSFHPIIAPNADSIVWMINDTLTSGWSPIRTFYKAGSFNVKMTAFYRGQSESIEKPVTIQNFPLTLTLVQDTTACREEFPPKRGSSSPKQFTVQIKVQGGTPQSIVWSNGNTGQFLKPDSAGYYYAVVTDAGGCSAYAGVNVREYGLQSQIYNKWYFGKNAGIDFTPSPPKPLSESKMDAPEGCAIACDRNGQQLFYTDGFTVWNKTHDVVATDIGGNTRATQSALIIAVPGDETLYYIFTTQDMNGTDKMQLSYSVYDIKANSGKGGVVQQKVFMYLKNTERITGTEQYLLVHELANSTFRAYPITATGLGNPKYTDIGSNHSAAIPHNVDGYLTLGPRNFVAAPISTPGISAKIEVFQLNDTTSMLKKFQSIDLNDNAGSIYGLQFSSSGRKLFASVRYTTNSSALYEYAIDSATLAGTFIQKIPVAADLGAIQVGPNGQIYVAVNNAGNNTSLGIINPVERRDDRLAKSTFQLGGFALAAGTNSWLGLPNFIQINSNPPQAPGLTVTAACSNQPTQFQGSGRDPNIEEYYFTVTRKSDNQVVATSDPQNKFNSQFEATLPSGDYKVTLRLSNRCDASIDFAQDFTVTPPPFNPSQGVPFCNTPTIDLNANPGNIAGLTYQWDTGETTKILTIKEVGIYNVDITDAKGCKTTAQFLAADSRPNFDLGPDQTICEGQNVAALNVRNANMTYQWKVDGVNTSTTNTQSVNTTVTGAHEYYVKVTDPLSTCFREDTKIFTINTSPDMTLAKLADPTGCGNTNGSIRLTIIANASAGPLYSYSVSGPATNQFIVDQNVPSGSTNYDVTGLGAGTYTAIVIDQISTCATQMSVGLSDANFAMSALERSPNCDPVFLDVTTNLFSTAITWKATSATQSLSGSATTNASGQFTIPGLQKGDFVIEVTSGVCTQTIDKPITPNPKITITFEPDLCALTLKAVGPADGLYTWGPASAINGTTGPGNTISLKAGNTPIEYSVHGTSSTGCPADEKITLTPGNGILPFLSQTDPCTEIVTMNAAPTGNFTYYWFVNDPTGSGTPDPSLGGSSVVLNKSDDGKTYLVKVYEPQSGCIRPSTALTAQVKGKVDALLSADPACADDQPIKLTATTTDPAGAAYAWKFNNTPIAGVTGATTSQQQAGNYSVEISKGTCKATSSLTVRRNPLPIVDIPTRKVICDDPENTDPTTRSVDLDPGAFIGYDWSKNGVTLNYRSRVLTADSKGEYQVEVTDAFGCKNKDATRVDNDCLPWLNGPNAFRPSSNVVNSSRPELSNADFWLVTRFIEDDQFKVFIFNRWGEMVFSSTDRFFKWNGGYNNDISRPVPPGTYSYVVQYVSAYRKTEGIKEKRGGVALIR